jgi:imidazolonepropionase-like amidohydrolase
MHAHVPSKRRGEQYARDILTLFLANGVTTIRGMLGERWHLELRDLLKHQEWPGPLLVTSGPSFNGNSVSSPSQAAQRVRDQHAVGYDFLKLHPGLAADEYAAIARTAAGLGIPIAGHVSVEVGLDATLEAQQASIDHLDGYAQNLVPAGSDLHGVAPEFFGINLSSALDPDIASHLAESTAAAEVWNVPTQSLLENIFGNSSVETLLNRDGMRYAGSDLKQSWVGTVERSRAAVSTADQQKFIQSRRRLVFELQQAGAGLLLGSDAPQIMNVPGFSVHEELEFLVLAGLTPLQALQSGTINTARFFGDKERGLVSKDMLADFVLLSDNPLINISATRNILGVMRGGHWYSRSALDKLLAGVAGRGL